MSRPPPVRRPAVPLAVEAKVPSLVAALGARSIVLVGLMGCGKSSVGRRLAVRLGLPFVDADEEIEAAHRKSIKEIFEDYGEPYFRNGEKRVVARLLRSGPQVLATGGGAFMDPDTRAAVKASGVSVWLKAELPLLMRRVAKRPNRPLLAAADPESVLRDLMRKRHPTYAAADVTIESRDVAHDVMADDVIQALAAHLQLAGTDRPAAPVPPPPPEILMTATAPASAADTPITVPVALGARSYDVLIAPRLLAQVPALLAARFPGARAAIVTDANVAEAHLPSLASAFGPACLASLVLPAGEATKSFTHLSRLCEDLLAAGVERGDVIVALGGGVIGDLAGFAASVLRRGVRLVQVPTSLLAQVDSSVGGKTAINTSHGKNLVGAFHQPSLVVADTDVLSTLAPRQLRAGYAEVVKYGLIADRAFFDRLEANAARLFGNDRAELTHAIETSVRTKAAIVARDETETGERMLLNFGHTFGHALEAWAGYCDRLLHGEAVAIGMAQAFRYSERAGFAPAGSAARVERHLVAMGLPTRTAAIAGSTRPDVATLVGLMNQDKKVQRGKLTFICTRGIGKAFVARDVAAEAIAAFLADELALPALAP